MCSEPPWNHRGLALLLLFASGFELSPAWAAGSSSVALQPQPSQLSAGGEVRADLPRLLIETTGDRFDERGAEAIERTRELVVERLTELPGFSVTVAVADQGTLSVAGGLADVESERPVTFETRFRIGSTSKALTGALAGRLRDLGKLELDRPLVDYSDTWAGDPRLTVAHLLSNQGGVRHYRGMEPLSRTHYATLRDGLAMFLDDPLEFAPGTDFSYSSHGFNLAGVILGEIDGGDSDYLQALERHVLTPLGMSSTGPDDVTVEMPQRAVFYMQRSGETAPAPPVDDSYKWPSGGLLSTPGDLVRFGVAFLEPGFLTSETLELVTTPRSSPKGETGYALGWRVHQPNDALAHRALHHGGSSVGGRSMLVVVPGRGVVVSILCNSQAYGSKETDAFDIAGWFADAFESAN